MLIGLNDRVLLEHAYKNVQEGVMSNIGHATLDIAGLIPGVGELADITNAIWYCTQKPPNYLFAALSIISCIPTLGDILGKGTKLAILFSKASPKIIKDKRLIKTNTALIDKIFKQCEKNEKLKPDIEKIRQAFNAFMGGAGKLGPSTVRPPGNPSARI